MKAEGEAWAIVAPDDGEQGTEVSMSTSRTSARDGLPRHVGSAIEVSRTRSALEP